MPMMLTMTAGVLQRRRRIPSPALLPLRAALPTARGNDYAGEPAVRRRGPTRDGKAMAVDEQRLISACQAGDRDAWREVYDRTVPRVYRLVFRMVRNADDAFDLTQDIYVRVFSGIGRFRRDCSLFTWVYRIAVNEALALLRRRRVEEGHQHEGKNDALRQSVNPSEPADRLDVRSALAALDDEDRTILLLRYDHGLDYQAIAQLLDCAEGTVASRLNRARQRLRAVLRCDDADREGDEPSAHQRDGGTGIRLMTRTNANPEARGPSRDRRASGNG